MNMSTILIGNQPSPLAAQTSIKRENVYRAFLAASVLILCLTMMMTFASAEPIDEGINTGLNKVYSLIKAIGVPIAGLTIAFAAYKVFVGGERGMEDAKKIVLYTAIAVGLIYFAPYIVSNVKEWFSSYDTDLTTATS